MDKDETLKAQQDITLIDLMLRLTSLEKLLIKKNIITETEYGSSLSEVLVEMTKTVKDAGYEDLSKILELKKK